MRPESVSKIGRQVAADQGAAVSRRGTTLPVLGSIACGCREGIRHGAVYGLHVLAWTIIVVVAYVPVLVPADDSFSVEAFVFVAHLPSIAMLVGSAVIFVAVNRAIVLQDVPTWWRAVRLGGHELRVLGLNLVFLVVGYLELALISTLVQFISGLLGIDVGFLFDAGLITNAVHVVLWGLLISATLTPFFGLAPLFAAIDAKSGMLRRSAAWSRGYGWRLGAIGFLPGVIVQVGSYAPFVIWTDWRDAAGRTALVGLSAAIYLCGAIVRAAAFGCAFRFIAEGRQTSLYGVFD